MNRKAMIALDLDRPPQPVERQPAGKVGHRRAFAVDEDVVAVEDDRAPAGGDHGRRHPQGGGLARPVAADQGDDLAVALGAGIVHVIVGAGTGALTARLELGAWASIAGFAFIDSLELWENAMVTLSLVLVATIIALVISVPVGIWAARSESRSSRGFSPPSQL